MKFTRYVISVQKSLEFKIISYWSYWITSKFVHNKWGQTNIIHSRQEICSPVRENRRAVATRLHCHSWGTWFESQPGCSHDVSRPICKLEPGASFRDLCWGVVSAVAFNWGELLGVGEGWDWFPPSHLLFIAPERRDLPADLPAVVLSSCAMGSWSPTNNRLPKAWLDRGGPWHVTGTRASCQLHANQTRNWSTPWPLLHLGCSTRTM
jgi:hypothetical protein